MITDFKAGLAVLPFLNIHGISALYLNNKNVDKEFSVHDTSLE